MTQERVDIAPLQVVPRNYAVGGDPKGLTDLDGPAKEDSQGGGKLFELKVAILLLEEDLVCFLMDK